MAPLTFGVKGDKTVTQWPFLHRLVKDDFFLESHHSDVLKQTQALQDLLHRLRLGLLGHGTDTNHYLSLWGLQCRGNIVLDIQPTQF